MKNEKKPEKRKNSFLENLNEMVSQLSLQDLWKEYVEALEIIKTQKKVVEAMNKRLRNELGDSDYLEIADGAGVYWQNVRKFTVPNYKLMDIVPDEDQRSLIMKVDFKKAKEVLSPEAFEALEKAKEVESVTKSFQTGEIKRKDY